MIKSAVAWIQQVAVPFLGIPGIFLASFLDSSFLSLPEINDFLMITSCAAHPARAPLYILATTLGSVLGCAVLWWLGQRGGEALLRRRFGHDRVDATRDTFHKWGVLAIAIPALLPPPAPFKIFVISAGVFGMPFMRFAITILIARGVRYTLWGLAGIFYGERALELLHSAEPWVAAHSRALLGWTAGLSAAVALVLWLRSRNRTPPRDEPAMMQTGQES